MNCCLTYLRFIIVLLLCISSEKLISQDCGAERWAIKTLSDQDTIKINFNNIITTTIKEQTTIPKEYGAQNKRRESETYIYSIDCHNKSSE